MNFETKNERNRSNNQSNVNFREKKLIDCRKRLKNANFRSLINKSNFSLICVMKICN